MITLNVIIWGAIGFLIGYFGVLSVMYFLIKKGKL